MGFRSDKKEKGEADEEEKLEVKKEIFATLGSDLILKDKKLTIYWDNLLFPIKSMAKEVRAIYDRLEPGKNVGVARDLGEIYSENPRLLSLLNEIRTFYQMNPDE